MVGHAYIAVTFFLTRNLEPCKAEPTGNIQLSQNELSEVVIWNNKFICVDGKSVYNYKLKNKGIIKLSDLKCESNEQAIWLNFRQLGKSPLDAFQLTALFDALPAEYRRLYDQFNMLSLSLLT